MNIVRKVIINSGTIVTVVNTNGGWTTVKNSEGKEQKLRNGALRDLNELELSMTTTSGDKAWPVGGGKPAKKDANAPKAAAETEKKPAKVKPGVVDALPESDTVLSGDGSEVLSNGKLVKPDYNRYQKHDIKTNSGRKSLDIGDEAAAILRGQAIEDCFFIVAKHLVAGTGKVDDEEGTEVSKVEAELKAKYQHLNVGMQRMNLGNRLRKALGTYGNMNAHKRATDMGGEHQGPNYGKRQGETLKRAADKAPA